jgi:hypothetical protein
MPYSTNFYRYCLLIIPEDPTSNRFNPEAGPSCAFVGVIDRVLADPTSDYGCGLRRRRSPAG